MARQLEVYQVMPTEELLVAERVHLLLSLAALISRHGLRVVCEECGEDIINGRRVRRAVHILCQAFVGEAYYERVETRIALPIVLPVM